MMMKKHNQLIILLVLISFIFTMVGSAGAASFSDVKGNAAEAAAIYRLNGLGIIDGYPDGTFGPEKTITRAEFAKIACITAGLKSVASGMNVTASLFSDVKADHWANGWINVAAAQGYVKGDPTGTFRPEDQITQAEAATVLMRILGYNDNLPGEWPSDYISKAANLGILDDVTFTAGQPATRGVVAILTSATLDENIVNYEASNNLFKTVVPAKTLLYDKFNESAKYKNILTTDFRVDSDGKLYLQYYQYNDDQDIVLDAAGAASSAVAANLLEKKLAANCVFPTGRSIISIMQMFVEFDVNKDGEISNIIIKDYGRIGPMISNDTFLSEVKVEGGKAKANDKTCSFISPSQVVKKSTFPTEFTISGNTFNDGTYNKADLYTLTFNKDGKIAGIYSVYNPTSGIVEKVVGDRIYYMDNANPVAVAGTSFSNQGNFTDEDIFVQKDSRPVALSDIQPLDAVTVMKNFRGVDYFIIASSAKISGKLESAEYSGTDVKAVNVNDKKWTLSYKNMGFLAGAATYAARYSIDKGNEMEGDLSASTLGSEYDLWKTDVTLLRSPTGKIVGLIFGDAAASSKAYGVVTEISGPMAWTDGTTVRNIKVMKNDGEEYSYPICDNTYIKSSTITNKKIKDLASLSTIDDYILSKDAGAASITAGSEKLVNVSLKSSGLVDRIEVINQADQAYAAGNLDTDNKLVKINGTWVDAADVVVFNLNDKVKNAAADDVTDLGDTKVCGWTEFKNAAGSYAAWYINNNNKLEYVVINSAPLSTGDKYAIYQEAYSDADDWVVFVGQDPIKRSALPAGVTKGDVVHYTMSGTEADVDARTVSYGAKSSVTIDKISGQTILLDKADSHGLTSYKTSKDTVYFDVKKDTALQVLDSVSVGDAVIVIPDAVDTSLAAAVVVVD